MPPQAAALPPCLPRHKNLKDLWAKIHPPSIQLLLLYILSQRWKVMNIVTYLQHLAEPNTPRCLKLMLGWMKINKSPMCLFPYLECLFSPSQSHLTQLFPIHGFSFGLSRWHSLRHCPTVQNILLPRSAIDLILIGPHLPSFYPHFTLKSVLFKTLPPLAPAETMVRTWSS